MSSTTSTEFFAGSLFGTALLLSGVYSPRVIISQMQLRDTHMLQSFLAASATSALVVRCADVTAWAPCRARKPSSYGYFPYDANVVGGMLVGAGMALAGACPGTVVVQVGAGLRSGYVAALGGLLGGIAYTKFAPYLRRTAAPSPAGEEAPQPASSLEHTLHGKLSISPTTLLALYEALCALALLAAPHLLPSDSTASAYPVTPVAGGLLIGAAQGVAVLLTRRTVGVSAAYQDLGRRWWKLVSSGRQFAAAKLATPATLFAAGILAGSAVAARGIPLPAAAEAAMEAGVSDARVLLGGVAMVAGAGLAGGCPSGHGISGMATFSLASFVSVAAMFGGGIAVAQVLLHGT